MKKNCETEKDRHIDVKATKKLLGVNWDLDNDKYVFTFDEIGTSVKVKNSNKLKTSWNSSKVTDISNTTIDLDTRDGILSGINCERFSHF